MLATLAVAGIIVYGIGLRADRIHARRAVTEPGAVAPIGGDLALGSLKEPEVVNFRQGSSASGSVTPRLYRGHNERSNDGAREQGTGAVPTVPMGHERLLVQDASQRRTPDSLDSVLLVLGRPQVSASRRMAGVVLYRNHSAGYWNWQYRVAKHQARNAVRYARKLERIIRARRHPAPTRTLSSSSPWDAVAACESGGDWEADTSNGYFGGLQFDHWTWARFGGLAYAYNANGATREQQIAVANRVTYDAWPNC